jgi:lipopolysaccharide export system permease protein
MIINRYLVREVAGPFVGVSVLLIVVFMTYSLSIFLSDASEGLLGPGQVAMLTLYKSVIALEVLLPIALYVGVMLGMGRLYHDAEMDALRAGGLGEIQIVMPLLRFALTLALLVGLLSVVVRPAVYEASYKMREEALANSEIDRIKGGRFYSYGDGGRTVFVETTSGSLDRLTGVFIRSSDARALEVVSASTGQFRQRVTPTQHELVLHDAQVFRRTRDGQDLFGEFHSFSMRLPVKQPAPVSDRPKLKSTFDLRSSTEPMERAEYQWRLSTPVSTLLLTMLAVPLSHTRPRQGRFARMLVAMVVYALYFNLLSVARTWVEQERVSTIAWVPALLAIAAIAMYVPWRWVTAGRRGN